MRKTRIVPQAPTKWRRAVARTGQNAWGAILLSAGILGVQAQQVISMRLTKIAARKRGWRAEALRMVAEKPSGLARAQIEAATALRRGCKPDIAAGKALGCTAERYAPITSGCEPADRERYRDIGCGLPPVRSMARARRSAPVPRANSRP
jgi:hypothetical protein